MTREEAIRALTIQLEYWEQLKEKNVLTDHEGNNVVDVLKMAIEALQREEHLVELEAKAVAIIKSERHGEWVPCSKRLPDVGRDVLFCDSEWTEEGCLRADGDWWQFRWHSVMPKEKVTAWKPLPMPYREESEVEP